MKKAILRLRPFLIFMIIAFVTYQYKHWWGFWLIFPWIGGWISVASFIKDKYSGKEKDIARKITILAIAPIFLIFLGLLQHENLQLEETVFYLYAGIFSRVLIHYAVKAVAIPLFFGRGFCGWACWTAALLDWLPIKENNHINPKFTYIRIPILLVSIAIPFMFIFSGYDYMNLHINEHLGKLQQFYWFLIGNSIYYLLAIPLAFIFKKKRAFCKILCPVSLVMKPISTVALIKIKPTENKCISCGNCNKNCPMDIDVMGYIKANTKVTSTECIHCYTCVSVCPVEAIN